MEKLCVYLLNKYNQVVNDVTCGNIFIFNEENYDYDIKCWRNETVSTIKLSMYEKFDGIINPLKIEIIRVFKQKNSDNMYLTKITSAVFASGSRVYNEHEIFINVNPVSGVYKAYYYEKNLNKTYDCSMDPVIIFIVNTIFKNKPVYYLINKINGGSTVFPEELLFIGTPTKFRKN